MSEADAPVRKALTIHAPVPAAMTRLAASPAALFQGYDSVTGEGLSTVVDGTTSGGGGADTIFHYTACTTMKSLAQSLEIEQSLSVGYGPFGSVSQKMKFVRNLEVTTYSVSIVVYARHVLGTESITGVGLKSGEMPPATDDEIRAFIRAYGDTYVSSVTRGGEYYAVYTFHSQTKREQESLMTELKAKGVIDVVKVDTSVQTKLDKFISESSTSVTFSQSMSGVNGVKLPDSDNILKFALDFSALTPNAPTIVAFQSTGYEHVPKFGTFEPIVKNRSYFVGTGADGGLTGKLVRIEQLKTQIDEIASIYKFYGGFTDTDLTGVLATAKADIATIDDQMIAFKDDPIQSFTTPKLPSLDKGLPVLRYKIGQSPVHGGGGGEYFRDVNPVVAVKEKTRITSIQMRAGARIDRIETGYENIHGRWIATHGGRGGSLGPILSFQDGQFITSVSGRSAKRVDRLKFTITDGRTLEGGRDGGAPFSWDVPDGSFVFGFSGRSGSEDDAIGFDYASFEKAKWES